MFKNNEKCQNTETAIKLLNQYADSYHQLEEQINFLKKENKDLHQNLQINKEIIQTFFKKSPLEKKVDLFIEKTKEENKLLLNQISDLKNQNNKLSKYVMQINKCKNDLEIATSKIFMFENLIIEKENIIANLNKRISLYKAKDKKNANEIYIVNPSQVVNKINENLQLYKDINQKLINHIKTLKLALSKREKEMIKMEKDLNKYKKEVSQYKQQKNNVEIISQLNQYQAMNSSLNRSTISKSQNTIHTQNDYIQTLNSSKNHFRGKKKSLYNEIERLENVNKNAKEIIENQFDLASEWYETLKHCNMTQEEYVNFCNNKLTVRLTDVIEYLYKFLIDKNIQIKLLSEENNYLNAENLNLNKLNLELQEQCEKISKNTVKDDNSTFVNIDNNITNNNININMMMDYMKEVKQSMTSSEFRDGMIIDQFDINSELNIFSIKNSRVQSERDNITNGINNQKSSIAKEIPSFSNNKKFTNDNSKSSNGASEILKKKLRMIKIKKVKKIVLDIYQVNIFQIKLLNIIFDFILFFLFISFSYKINFLCIIDYTYYIF